MDSIEKQINTILGSIASQISGTIGLSVVELTTGLPLAVYSTQKDFDLDVAAAYNAEVVKQKMKAMEALSLKDQAITEMVIYLTTQTHFIRFINQDYILYFAVDTTLSNVAMIKIVLNKEMPKINGLINGL